MKSVVKSLFLATFFVFLSILALSLSNGFVYSKAYALSFPSGHLPVSVQATIGQYHVSLSGFIAPFASVVLTSDNVVLSSVAADSGGYFSFTNVLVKQGFDHFCFTAVDVKRLGQSDSCFTIPPIVGDFSKSNIFLPPTIGLFRTQVQVGSNAIIWGYSMSGATVSIHSSDGTVYTATADNNGFYKITTLISKAGSYDLSATAVLKQQNSEKPTNKVTLIALTFAQSTNQGFLNFLKQLLTFIFNLPLGPLWLAIPILILIFILLRKLKGKPILPAGPKFGKEKLFFDFLFKPKKLHHHWMKGVGF